MKNTGIHLRLILAVFALICATTFTLGYAGISISRQFIQDRFQKRITSLAKYLALNAELGVLIDNREMLNKLALNLMTEDDLAGVAISDRDSRPLIVLSKDLPGPFAVVKESILLSGSESNEEMFEADSLPHRETSVIGSVQITFSTSFIEEILNVMAKRFIWFSAGLACLAGLVFYFLSRSMVRPVTRLARLARGVARGDLSLRAETGGPPETRDLALAFNSMLASLKSSRDELESAYQEIIQQNALAEVGKFSLMIAHEVKNPLGIIKSSLDVLKGDGDASRNETVIGYMEDEIRRLNALIEDFLTFARPARPCLREVDVSGLLQEMVEKFEIQWGGADTPIHSLIEPGLQHERMDPDMFGRAVANILKNAFEANGRRGEVRLRAGKKDGMLWIDIEDRGNGIDPAQIHQVFEPFYTTRSKGTGLGLAYVSQVVNIHKGTVTAQNRDEGGACFRMEIPLNPARAA